MVTPTNALPSPSTENPFKRGTKVEIALEDEGFRGSWYTATVLRPLSTKKPSKNRLLFVQYDTLTDINIESEPLREYVNFILVRPYPPRESLRRFTVGEDVDAFHNDGWWEGIVIAVIDDGKCYSIFFRRSREQIDFTESQLRLHREWVYGRWVPDLEDVKEEDV